MKGTADAACAASIWQRQGVAVFLSRHLHCPETYCTFLQHKAGNEDNLQYIKPSYCKFDHSPLGRSPPDSSKINLPARICRESAWQAVRPTMPTEAQLSNMFQQRKRKRPTEPPAAPRRKLPQQAFHQNVPAACGSTAVTPVFQCKSEPSVPSYQNCYLQSEALQAQTNTSLLQSTSCAASMSKLVAVASPISSAEHLLQRLRFGGVGARLNASNGHEQSCVKYVIPALTSCGPCHTGGSLHIWHHISHPPVAPGHGHSDSHTAATVIHAFVAGRLNYLMQRSFFWLPDTWFCVLCLLSQSRQNSVQSAVQCSAIQQSLLGQYAGHPCLQVEQGCSAGMHVNKDDTFVHLTVLSSLSSLFRELLQADWHVEALAHVSCM